jgi:ATP-dependent protease HslVU (ClpYQ) peptidase subunit
VALEAMRIAATICIYTNGRVTTEELPGEAAPIEGGAR